MQISHLLRMIVSIPFGLIFKHDKEHNFKKHVSTTLPDLIRIRYDFHWPILGFNPIWSDVITSSQGVAMISVSTSFWSDLTRISPPLFVLRFNPFWSILNVRKVNAKVTGEFQSHFGLILTQCSVAMSHAWRFTPFCLILPLCPRLP